MDKIFELFFWQIFDMLLLAGIFIYFVSSRAVNSFVKAIFLSACSLLFVNDIFVTMLFRLNIDALYNIFGFESSLAFIRYTLSWLGYFLLFWGVTLLIGNNHDDQHPGPGNPYIPGKRKNLGVQFLLFIVTLGVYFPFWLYRTVEDLKRNPDLDISYSPGQAVGYLFIPLFNIYWGIYIMFSLPRKVMQIEKIYFGKKMGFHFHPILISIMWLLIFIIAYFWHSDIQLFIAKSISIVIADFIIFLTIQAKLNVYNRGNQANAISADSTTAAV